MEDEHQREADDSSYAPPPPLDPAIGSTPEGVVAGFLGLILAPPVSGLVDIAKRSAARVVELFRRHRPKRS